MPNRYEQLLEEWFSEGTAEPASVAERSRLWFEGDADFDQRLLERFADLPARAMRGELEHWMGTDRGTLALILALDQLPRNFYRDSAAAFRYDDRAQQIADHAVAGALDRRLGPVEAVFVYLPFEHAEDPNQQLRSVQLFSELLERAPPGLDAQFQQFLDFAQRHQAVIAQFGRFPHRNEVLGRRTTAAEAEFLDSGGEQF